MWRLARQVGLQLHHSPHQSSSPSTCVSSYATENMFILWARRRRAMGRAWQRTACTFDPPHFQL